MTSPRRRIAKLSRPRLFGAVPRNSLFERLDALAQHPCVWVCAPPGAGKTTAVGTWIDSRSRHAHWYQVDRSDADPSTFFRYLSELAPTQRGRRPLPLLTPEYLDDIEGFARRYFREFFARLGDGDVLVIDNLHEVLDDAALEPVFIAMVSEMPARTTAILVGRFDPPAWLAEPIARQQLVTLGWDALRFTQEETRAAVTRHHGFANATADALHAICGGWVSCLTLTLEWYRRTGVAPEHSLAGAREASFDYFASLFFDDASEENQQLLCTLAIAPHLTVPIANALTGDVRAGELLESLYRRNMFVQRRPGRDPSYQLHALLRNFLLHRALVSMRPEQLQQLTLKAGDLLADAGDPDAAFELYADARAWHRASDLVLVHAERLFAEGRWRTILDWLRTLPASVVDDVPWLRYWLGMTQFQIDQSESRRSMSAAYEQFDARQDPLGKMLTAASVLLGYYLEYSDWSEADVWIPRLAEQLESDPGLPSTEIELTVYSALLCGIAIRRPEHPMLDRAIARTMDALRRPCDPNVRMLAALAVTGPVCCMLGAFELFRDARRQLQSLPDDPHLNELSRAAWYMTCGAKLSFCLEDEAALDELRIGEELAASAKLRHVEFLSVDFRAWHLAWHFAIPEATAALERMRTLADLDRPLERLYLMWVEAALLSVEGKGHEALSLLRPAQNVAIGIGSQAHLLIGSLLHCGPLIMTGDLDGADAIVRDALAFGEMHRVHTWDAAFHAASAWSALERGDEEQARTAMHAALSAGRDGSGAYLRWLGIGARRTLEFALEQGIETTAARDLVRRFRYRPDGTSETWPWAVRVYTLGRFEVLVDDKPLTFGRKTPRKPLALLQYLVAQDDAVPTHVVADALWPDADGDEGHRRLIAALHRLRRLLGYSEAIRSAGGKLSIDRQLVWVDLFAVEAAMSGTPAVQDPHAAPVARIGGTFLEGELESPWVIGTRERLAARMRHHVRAANR